MRSEADTFKFYDDSKLIHDDFKEHPYEVIHLLLPFTDEHGIVEQNIVKKLNVWNRANDDGLWNDNRIMIKLNGWIHFFAFGNYYIHLICFNIISFLGVMALYCALGRMKFNRLLSYLILFFLPSLTFWSSGIMKDGVLLFGLGLFILGLTENQVKRKFIFTSIGFILLSCIKVYILICALPILLIVLLIKFTSIRPVIAYLVTFLCLTTLIFIENRLNGDQSLIHLAIRKQAEFIRYTQAYHFGSSLYMPTVNQLTDLILLIPFGLTNSLFQPYPWLIKSPIHAIGFIENVLIIILMVKSCSRHSLIPNSPIKTHAFLFSISILILIGCSTPNFGALVRYRAVALPFLILPLVDDSKIRAISIKVQKSFKRNH